MRPVIFLGDCLGVIRRFPAQARRDVGYQIDRLQRGLEPNDWKPLKTVGAGVREIRVRDDSGAFRVVYVVSFADAVYILQAFRKTTRTTSRPDLELAEMRYKDLLRRHRR